MRILIVTQYFWPEEFRINDITEGLIERGHEIVVLTGLPNYPKGRFEKGYGFTGPYTEDFHGAKVVRTPMLARGSNAISLVFNYFTFALMASLVGPFRCKGQFDAVLVFEPSPIFVGIPARVMSWLKRAPILFWVQDLWPESLSATGVVKSRLVLRIVEAVVRWIYRGCSLILVQSRAFVEPIRRLGVPVHKIVYFPNSAESFYRPVERHEDWGGPPLPDGFRVMFAGNIGTAQSFETILSAAELIRDKKGIHWIIIGDGRQLAWVREQVDLRDLTMQVHLMGRHPVETMPEWFGQADIMLVALRRDKAMAMTIPAKVQSYLACAKPIVASIDGEGARIIELAAAGLSAPAENAAALADKVKYLYEMPSEKREEMGKQGLDYFKGHFSREVLLNQLENWFVKTRKSSI